MKNLKNMNDERLASSFLLRLAFVTAILFFCSCLRTNSTTKLVGGQKAKGSFRSTYLILAEPYDLPSNPEAGHLRLPAPGYPQAGPKVVVAFCTGALLRGGYVMTAAHCVLDSDGKTAPAFERGARFWITNKEDFSDAIDKKVGGISKRYLNLEKTNALQLAVESTAVQQYYRSERSSFGGHNAPDIAVIKVSGVSDHMGAGISNKVVADHERVAFAGYGCRTEAERNQKVTSESARDGSLPVQLRLDDDVRILSARKAVSGVTAESFFVNYMVSPKPSYVPEPSDSSTCFGDSGMPIYRGESNIIVGVHDGSLLDDQVNYHSRVDSLSLGGQWLRHVLPGAVFVDE